MKIWLVEILVRLGVSVIADGRCRPRWYGSDQGRVCRRERGLKLTPAAYYTMRKTVTGSNWQHKQYRRGMLEILWPTLNDHDRYILSKLSDSDYEMLRQFQIVKRVLA